MPFSIPSQTHPTAHYRVTAERTTNGRYVWTCTCPARRSCWHKDAASTLTTWGCRIEQIDLHTALIAAAVETGDWTRVNKHTRTAAKAAA